MLSRPGHLMKNGDEDRNSSEEGRHGLAVPGFLEGPPDHAEG